MPEDQVERHLMDDEADHLLSEEDEEDSMEMADLDRATTADTTNKSQRSHLETRYTDGDGQLEASRSRSVGDGEEVALTGGPTSNPMEYKVYKIRWFGLVQLILLNIVVSWDVRRVYCSL